jgi:hypothetical protein
MYITLYSNVILARVSVSYATQAGRRLMLSPLWDYVVDKYRTRVVVHARNGIFYTTGGNETLMTRRVRTVYVWSDRSRSRSRVAETTAGRPYVMRSIIFRDQQACT